MPDDWLPSASKILTHHRWTANQHPALVVRPALAFVVHIQQGRPSYLNEKARERPPKSPYVSSHFNLARSGMIWQNVGLDDTAWTNGKAQKPTWLLYDRVKDLPDDSRLGNLAGTRNCNPYTITAECEGFSIPPGYGYDYCYGRDGASDPNGRKAKEWPPALLNSLYECAAFAFDNGMIADGPSADTVIGHVNLDTVTRMQDPGAWFMMRHMPDLISKLRPAQGKLQPKPTVQSKPKPAPAPAPEPISPEVAAELTARIAALEKRLYELGKVLS